MPFGFISGRQTADTLFVVGKMQDKYREKNKKLYMCFVDLEKTFDRVPKRVMQQEPKKRGIPEIFVKEVMSLYEDSKTKVKVGSKFSEEFYVAVGR